jgi:hypothetical protein
LITEIKNGLQKSLDFVSAETPSDQNIKDLHKTMAGLIALIAQSPKES